MEVKEAQKRKQELQMAIAGLIAEFESETGFFVEKVNVERLIYQFIDERRTRELARVTVETRL